MSILDYELLQAYTPKQYIPEDFKAYVNYGRIKIKINDGAAYGGTDYGIKIKFTKSYSYTPDFNTLNNDKHIPLYYTVGTYETWRTGSTEADAGGGWDYGIERKTNPYKWKRCYIDSECNIRLPEKLSKNNCAYIYFANCPDVNIEVKSTFPILGTHGMNDIELEGDFSSYQYQPKFKNSDFTSAKNVILNDSNTITSRSSMFANNKYLRYIPDCIKTLYTKNINSKTDNAYYRMFENCTSLENVSLNIIEEQGNKNYSYYLFNETFYNCKSLRNISIKYDYDYTELPGVMRNTITSNSLFNGCSSVQKVTLDMYSPFDTINSNHDIRYWTDMNHIFQLGDNTMGENIDNKYVTFTKFSANRKDPDGRKNPSTGLVYTDSYLANEAVDWFNYPYNNSSNWTTGNPVNTSMPNIGLGNDYNIKFYLHIGDANSGYFGSIYVPRDSTYSCMVEMINNFSKVNTLDNKDGYITPVTIGSIETFVIDEYIIGSVKNIYGQNNLYKLYDNNTKKYVKVTDYLDKNGSYQTDAIINLYFKNVFSS